MSRAMQIMKAAAAEAATTTITYIPQFQTRQVFGTRGCLMKDSKDGADLFKLALTEPLPLPDGTTVSVLVMSGSDKNTPDGVMPNSQRLATLMAELRALAPANLKGSEALEKAVQLKAWDVYFHTNKKGEHKWEIGIPTSQLKNDDVVLSKYGF